MSNFRQSLPQILYKQWRSNAIRYKGTTVTTSKDGENSDYSNSIQDAYTGSKGSGGIQAGVVNKLKARRPLVKNFFIGVVDKELLGYPEVISREDMNTLQNAILPFKNFFADEIDTNRIDATRSIPTKTMDDIKELGLYGFNVPIEHDGKGWSWSESLIAAAEEVNCPDIAISLLSHRAIVDLLIDHGSDEQKHRFLNKLGKGEYIGSEAIYEFSAPEYDFFNTTALFNPDNSTWLLNGGKAFVVTGPLPSGSTNLFLVIAQSRRSGVTGDAAQGSTLFLVDQTTPGVKIGEQHITIGCRGLQMRHIIFQNVTMPQSCVIGHPHEGNIIAEMLLRSNRLRSSAIGFGFAKKILNNQAEYCAETKQCGVDIKDLEMVRNHLSKSMCSTYAMESMIFLTAGLMDEFYGQDVGLEAAITKYYTMKELFKIATTNMDMIGPKSLHSGEETEIAFRTASQLYTLGESIDTMRLYIAMNGFQHAGQLNNDTIRKQRNPLFHPGHVFSRFLENSSLDKPNTSKMRLRDNVHPSLEPAAQCIEHSVARLQMCVDLLLTRHGPEIIERHNEMQRIADITSEIYAMFASTARASRSYCIGLSLADHELLTASTICSLGHDNVKYLSTDIFNGHYLNSDNNLMRLSKRVIQNKGHFAEHPLTYNF